ncbi:hypothetical protein [Hyphomicrobium sp. 99]|uniref:hypothetical protein n=1 Tax=Hyphomicrobium sp. 99 TaxID=1163419 RepID=UPI0005F81E70|nr:hypothetical protein [Hyphomicrobium sp. 99]
MLNNSPFALIAAAFFAAVAMTFAGVPSAFAMQKMLVGPVAFEVADNFKEVAGKTPSIHQDASGITVEAAELPLEALHEFKGQAFLDFLASLKYTNAAYADGALKRGDAYTYVLADAKGPQGPESRFLLVLGGEGRAAIVTAYAPKSEFENGHASRAAIEAILSSAAIVPAGGKP